MTTTWVCGDLPTAVAEAIRRGTLGNLAGAAPVDEGDREGAHALLRELDAQHRQDPVVKELLQRLAPPYDPYPGPPQRQGARA